jgi:O-antigen/teichoic acid export membrane protein
MPLKGDSYRAVGTNFAALKSWLTMGKNLILIGIARQFLHRVNILLLGAMASPEQVGLFAIAFQIGKLIGLAIESVDTVIVPIVSEAIHKGDKASLQKVFSESLAWLTLVSGVAGGVILLGGNFILAFFGPAYQDGYTVLVTLTTARLVAAVSGPTATILIMSGNEIWLLMIRIIGGAISIAMGVVLIPIYNAQGAAVATLIGILAVNVLALVILYRKYGLTLRFKIPTPRLYD